MGKIEKLTELIVQDLKMEEDEGLINIGDLEELKEKLEKIVAYLLDNDFERLINAMYRLDINEEKFKMAVSGLHKKDTSREIVELIVSREIQKLRTRIKYGGF
jgi:hypothetical protein